MMWRRAVPMVDCCPLLCFTKHNRAAVQIREDMKKMVHPPMAQPWHGPAPARPSGSPGVFGVALLDVRELGLVKDGVPMVMRTMVEYLRQHGLEQEGLFRVSGSVRAVDGLRRRLDSREQWVELGQEVEVCTVASLLKQYLRELPEGLVHPSVQNALIQLQQESSEDDFCKDVRSLLQRLPDVHYSVLRYLCHFLTQVEQQQNSNRMTALNLATVFGPNIFHVSPGFDGMHEQSVCNKITATLIQNYSAIFGPDEGAERAETEALNVILVKEAHMDTAHTQTSLQSPTTEAPSPILRKKATRNSSREEKDSPREKDPRSESLSSTSRKIKKAKCEVVFTSLPQPVPSSGFPHSRQPVERSSSPRVESTGPGAEHMELGPPDLSPVLSAGPLSSSQEDERPISPFYVSSQISPGLCRPALRHYLERTIRSAVQQHLFDVHMRTGQRSPQRTELTGHSSSPMTTARERRRQQREQAEIREKCRDDTDKENIPSTGLISPRVHGSAAEKRLCATQDVPRARKPRHDAQSPEWSLSPHSAPPSRSSRSHQSNVLDSMESANNRKPSQLHTTVLFVSCPAVDQEARGVARGQTPAMKIQECLSGPEPSEHFEDVPRLDLTALTEDADWGEPVPAYSSWQRESMDRDEARLSPHAGGRLIRQLLDEGEDPMLSPRFYAYGGSEQYLDDPEVPPSPPNAHSFISRRRSSSLGSCDDDREELSTAQLSKKIHGLKRKIRKFEEKFEEERKYRPSHSDKAANSEVLRWMNELAKLRKELKEHKLLKSEEDLIPLPRQRSNTLPKSFGSQLERKVSEAKALSTPAESTLGSIMNKLQEKRAEVSRPEDIKDMTREQIVAEKVALQKALLYYEGIHGRPVTKAERQLMKPLYDRYRLVKQILCRPSTIPVIGSPSSKRRAPHLQPIIEGEPALFFDHFKEEEDGSDEDNDNRTQVTHLTGRPELSMLGLLEHLDEEVDGFISPVDDLSPSKNTTDMRLSNLHAATTQELVEQLQEAREEKKRIRKSLREFEDQFFRQNGRNVQKEDRTPLAVEYNEYKHIKAKLKLLEVLISKRDSSKFI
ncbi:protein FAM13A [Electrophorus electricus]|uniref:protein FAM13A n=1 Tax=Electrophorus electricus TaxID=8005 RepID=UPI0015D07C5C|nr:protein FAM13A [Electrophorus electricus]